MLAILEPFFSCGQILRKSVNCITPNLSMCVIVEWAYVAANKVSAYKKCFYEDN